MNASSFPFVKTYVSQIRELIRDMENRKNDLDEMDKDSGFLLQLQKLKRNNKTFMQDVNQKIKSFFQTVFVRNAKVNDMIKHNLNWLIIKYFFSDYNRFMFAF